MSVKFHKDVFNNVIVEGCREASWAVAQQIRSDTHNLVPKDQTILRSMVRVVVKDDGGATITWQAPYAHYQYTHEFQNYTTPGTGGHWVEKAEENRRDVWNTVAQNAFAKGMKRGV